jgi:hypothetical protein
VEFKKFLVTRDKAVSAGLDVHESGAGRVRLISSHRSGVGATAIRAKSVVR